MTALILQDLPNPLRGDLRIIVRDAVTREPIRRLLIKNTITYGALNAITQLLAQLTGTTIANFKIASLRVGTDPTAPVRTQTDLIVPIFTIPLSNVPGEDKIISVAPYELKILTTLEAGDANGYTLQEAGLFLSNNTMFSRQTHPSLPKSSAVVIDYDWRLEFTA